VDTDLFTPLRRKRVRGPFRIGHVGRLTTEKNVRFLAECGRASIAEGHTDFEIELIGQVAIITGCGRTYRMSRYEEFFWERNSQKPTRIWTFLCFHPVRIRSAMWC
jgi:hypothetical protein